MLVLTALDEEKHEIDGGAARRGASVIARTTDPVFLNMRSGSRRRTGTVAPDGIRFRRSSRGSRENQCSTT